MHDLRCLLARQRHRNDALHEQYAQEETKTDLKPRTALFDPTGNSGTSTISHHNLSTAASPTLLALDS
ncbi:hypothetical protein GS397_05950 [Sphingobium yanoikuyae]|jgi:hypothetical protein|uniref:Uncharacterized protein n=1 Tax=Sphingobium yanoikuyae TaxID=13690 RepID=A0A6P1GE43_SPHYA|nr:hypothetical protein [Sphingobium yanoikuyae]QHD66650.1 hypothetical protein GS397_05950 [Sphingobium yanoikuyae]